MSRSDSVPMAHDDETAQNSEHWREVGDLLGSLYRIVDRLEALFPERKFTPDGHLVGSIGGVIAAHMFDLTLLPGSSPEHDAVAADGRKVQIKFTQGTRGAALRAEPEHLLVLRLRADRTVETVYNGKGHVPWSQSGSNQSNGQRPISLARLRAINETILSHERISQRRDMGVALRVIQ